MHTILQFLYVSVCACNTRCHCFSYWLAPGLQSRHNWDTVYISLSETEPTAELYEMFTMHVITPQCQNGPS